MLLEIVRREIKMHNLIPPGDSVVLGVSGGTDSLALMHIMAQLAPQMGFTLHIATFDHGWRGKNSAADATFVKTQAVVLGLPVTLGRAGETTSHTEAAARQARYQFLAATARQINSKRIAVAHHADDQSETVLMRLLRGTGLHGLGAMRYQSKLPYAEDLTLIRPLLRVRRQAIEAYCQSNNIIPREDPSNKDITYQRNHIRHNILPALTKINPNVHTALANLAEIAAADSQYIDSVVQQHLAQSTTKKNGRLYLQREPLLTWHIALQRRAMRSITHQMDTEATIGFDHIESALEIARNGKNGAVAQFPGKVQMRISYDQLIFEQTDAPLSLPQITLAATQSLEVKPDTPVSLTNGQLTLRSTKLAREPSFGVIYLNEESILLARNRQSGDRIAPPGMNGQTRSLKKWMIDRKIPASQRSYIPLLTAHDNVIAVLHSTAGTVAHPHHQSTSRYPTAYYIQWKPS